MFRETSSWRDGGMSGGVFSLSGEGLDYLLNGLAGEVRIEILGTTNGCDFAGGSTIRVEDSQPPAPEPEPERDVVYTVLDPQ